MSKPLKVNAQPKGQKIWEATSLKSIVEKMIKDPRMVGLTRYIVNVRIFWSFEIPTACAGHGFIFFNPNFFESIPEETRKTVIVHEIWHLILKHLERGKDCDPYQHNIAADHVINNALEDDGFTFEGTDPCKDPQYKGMSTEQVYNRIYEKKPKDRPIPDMANHISSEKIEDMVEEVLEQDSNGVSMESQKADADKDASAAGKEAGNITGNQGIVLELTNARIAIIGASYETIFEDFLTDPLSSGRRTFMRPNRRQIGMKNMKLRLPGRYPKRGHLNRLTHLTYALDVSGSINDKQKQQFHDSVRTIKELLNPEKLTVLFFDTRIKMEKTFTDKEPYSKIRVTAGGGTDLRDVYRRTGELKTEALVIFTDMYVDIPPKPNWDTIWLITSRSDPIPPDLYGEIYLIPDLK